MGADGGTIPKRCELVKAKKKVEKVDKATKNATKWKNCQLTQTPLKKPVVADKLGRLYNKETVIEAILTKTIGNYEVAAHIKGIKDFKELNLTDNKEFKADEVKGAGYLDPNLSQFNCPVTGLPMNGNHNFLINWKCGCVFSEKATQEVKTSNCYGCGGLWDPSDSLMINPDDELLEQYKAKLAAEKAEKKLSKKEKKDSDAVINGKVIKKEKADVGEKVKKAEKRKISEEESDIQNDPTKPESFKKLFTTSKEAKAKPQGHWTTYNPLYF